MPLLLHGDNQKASRQYLSQKREALKKRGYLIKYLDGKTISKKDLEIELKNTTLFAQEALILENLLSRPNSREKQQILTLISQKTQKTLILWEAKTIPPTTLKKLKNVEIKLFKLPPEIFKFLDSLYPGNIKTSYHHLHQARAQSPDQVIFALLAKRVRELLLAKTNPSLLSGASWQKQHLQNQASRWTLPQLKNFSHLLLELDLALKTSRYPLDIQGALDLLLLKTLT